MAYPPPNPGGYPGYPPPPGGMPGSGYPPQPQVNHSHSLCELCVCQCCDALPPTRVHLGFPEALLPHLIPHNQPYLHQEEEEEEVSIGWYIMCYVVSEPIVVVLLDLECG